jgi:hypothetical protein
MTHMALNNHSSCYIYKGMNLIEVEVEEHTLKQEIIFSHLRENVCFIKTS